VPFDRTTGEIERDSIIYVDSGLVYTDTIPLKLSAYGSSLVQFALGLDSGVSAAMRISAGASDYVDIQHSSSIFHVMYSTDNSNSNDTIHSDAQALGAATLNISGKVMYSDLDQSYANKGVFGVPVILVFLRHSEVGGAPSGSYYHPFDGYVYGVNYTTADVNGNFSFSFNGPADWSVYTDVLLFVGKQNNAVHDLQSADQVTFWMAYSSSFLTTAIAFPESEGAKLPITDIHTIAYSNILININRIDGAILRDMMLSRDFDGARGVAQPGAITVYNKTLSADQAGIFVLEYHFLTPNFASISIDPEKGRPFLATIAHEYGHFQNYYNMNVSAADWFSSSSDFVEGWAEFHQFAVRNYAAAVYNEYSPWWDDNQEEDAFSSPRFSGIRYYTSATKSGFSCFLWNVYDKYTDAGFKASLYGSANNNDDIGVTNRVFDVIAGWDNSIDIDSYMIELYAHSSTEESNSIGNIYGCMLGDGSTLMRSAQIGSLTGYVDEMPHSGGPAGYPVRLSWESQNYTGVFNTGTLNIPTGIKVYQSNGSGGWNLLTTLGPSATTYTYRAATTELFTYKVTAYNSSGESYGAPTITCMVVSKIAIAQTYDRYAPPVFNVSAAFPNPFKESFDIGLDLLSGSRITYELVNVLGQVVRSAEAIYDSPGLKSIHVSTSSLAAGVYSIRLVGLNGSNSATRWSGKIIKMQ
jgi:hypothetical protein